ncbi:DUF3857 domain-containing protein [Echinicola jeungdonensis]|uniref:DUF3857 domain-containing protein n=1 Tax=Echinicola jeungdonensis TaxID=709343 RepID=A0ABV5JAD6_9BACT|nr:DUF3857 domain-containing protein [Echinicola jeungdonensis]MDN3669436.1 DUF3857 domain-containing protein [Echinicola jeungdonensis]
MSNFSSKKMAISLLALVFLFNNYSLAQDLKLGKYSREEINMTSCPFEPDASAVILGEVGESFYSHGKWVTEHIHRIKILEKSGKDHADVTLRYYVGDDNLESITGIKAQVMNFENGKEIITKVGKKEMFESDEDNGYKEIRFTFPNVKVGSILEYKYDHNYYSITFLDGWVFQNEIPTLFSKFVYQVPKDLSYRMLGQGMHFIEANKLEQKGRNSYVWSLKNLKSISPEPYMSNFVDYLDKIEFQLTGYKDPSTGFLQTVLNDWQKLSNEIFDIYEFKSYYRNNSAFKDLKEIPLEGESEFEIAQSSYNFIQENFTLNDEGGFIPSKTLKELMESRTGKETDLNMLFLAMLHANGIEAYPVLISSKGNGRSQLVTYPFVRQFNRLIISSILDGERVFADLSKKEIPLGYLRLDYHVDGGFLIRERESCLIPIGVMHKSGIKQLVEVSLENDSLSFAHDIRYIDYDAVKFEKRRENLEEDQTKILLELEEDLKLEELNIREIEGSKRQVEATFKVLKSTNKMSDMLIIEPLSFARFEENKFKADERVFPVDFDYVFSDAYIVNFTIPENYQLDDYPEEMYIKMPGGQATFKYAPQVINGNLKIYVMMDINSKKVKAQDYQSLKSFMEMMVNKIKEPVVLKKTS